MTERTLRFIRSSLGIVIGAAFALIIIAFAVMSATGIMSTRTLQSHLGQASESTRQLNSLHNLVSYVQAYRKAPSFDSVAEVEAAIFRQRERIDDLSKFNTDPEAEQIIDHTRQKTEELLELITRGDLIRLDKEREIWRINEFTAQLSDKLNEVLLISTEMGITLSTKKVIIEGPFIKYAELTKNSDGLEETVELLKIAIMEKDAISAKIHHAELLRLLRRIRFKAPAELRAGYVELAENIENWRVHENLKTEAVSALLFQLSHFQIRWAMLGNGSSRQIAHAQATVLEGFQTLTDAINKVNRATTDFYRAQKNASKLSLNIAEFTTLPTTEKAKDIEKNLRAIMAWSGAAHREIMLIKDNSAFRELLNDNPNYSALFLLEEELLKIQMALPDVLNAYRLAFNGSSTVGKKLLITTTDISDEILALVAMLETKALKDAENAVFTIVLGLVIGVFACVLSIYLIVHKVLKPIKLITRILDRISHGEMDVDINVDRRDEIGAMLRAANVFRDNLVELHHIATHDKLTDLPNRKAFNDYLSALTHDGTKSLHKFAMHMIDLDRFKEINDLHGHPAGDEVIEIAASRLKDTIRENDFVARLGGDEFAVIQVGVTETLPVINLGERIIESITAPIKLTNNATVTIGASIGSAMFPSHTVSDIELVSKSDTALYFAKNFGRGRCKVFSNDMNSDLKRRKAVESDLDIAIAEGQFQVYMQPRMNLSDQSIASYEALVRWVHPIKGLIQPDKFIPIAEETSRIVPIGKIVMREAASLAKREFADARVSINVSPLQFRDANLLYDIKSTIEQSGLRPDQIEVEITENVLIEDDMQAASILSSLKDIGVHIALDDFGTGYSSLGYLSRFPFDTLKIDQSFVRGMLNSESNKAIVVTMISLAKSLGITIVAEGVEDEATLRFLCDHDCDEIQGYVLGKPVPIEELLREIPSNIMDILKESAECPNKKKRNSILKTYAA